jgi:hypothetical protein
MGSQSDVYDSASPCGQGSSGRAIASVDSFGYCFHIYFNECMANDTDGAILSWSACRVVFGIGESVVRNWDYGGVVCLLAVECPV